MRFQQLMSREIVLTFLLTLAVIPASTSFGGSVSFDLSIDTTSFSGTSGDVEIQLGSNGPLIPSPITATDFLPLSPSRSSAAFIPRTVETLAPAWPVMNKS